jgi:hypothetical protein
MNFYFHVRMIYKYLTLMIGEKNYMYYIKFIIISDEIMRLKDKRFSICDTKIKLDSE